MKIRVSSREERDVAGVMGTGDERKGAQTRSFSTTECRQLQHPVG